MQVQLICHGMMLFWYRKPTVANGKDDGYTILIPQAPAGHSGGGGAAEKAAADDNGGDHGHGGGHEEPGGGGEPKSLSTTARGHEVRLGIGVGAPDSVLEYCATPMPTKRFRLAFSCKESPKHRAPKNALNDLVLYRPNAMKAVPHIDTGSKDAGIAFTIEIPYPRFEEPVRVATYKRDPYSGHAATHFGICARMLVGARVLTFEVQDPKDGIYLQNLDDSPDRRPILGSITGDVKLHLYSQPRVVPPKSNHLEVFKKMVRLNQKPLEICLVDERGAEIDPPWLPRPNGLSIIDTLHLHELPPRKQYEQEEKIPLEAMTIDPAECNQGGGC